MNDAKRSRQFSKSRAKWHAKNITWRQAMTLDWIVRGARERDRGSFISGPTLRSLYMRGLIHYPYSNKRVPTERGYAVVVLLRRRGKV